MNDLIKNTRYRKAPVSKNIIFNLSILSVLCGVTSHAYADSKIEVKPIYRKIKHYKDYEDKSNNLSNISIPHNNGDNPESGTAIRLSFQGGANEIYNGEKLKLYNIDIGMAIGESGLLYGISDEANYIDADKINIIITWPNGSDIMIKDSVMQDHQIKVLPADFTLTRSTLDTHGDMSNAVIILSDLVSQKKTSNFKMGQSTINTYGDYSSGLSLVNATANITNKSTVNLFGKNDTGVTALNGSEVLFDDRSAINSTSPTATGILLSMNTQSSNNKSSVLNDDPYIFNDEQRVLVNNNSVINVKNGTGILAQAGKDTVGVANGSKIISNILIDVKKAGEDNKDHPTNMTLNVSGNSVVTGAAKTENGATSSVNIASGSRWNITGDSNLTNLKTNDASVNFGKNADKFTTTQVDNLSGNNGTYSFAVDVLNQKGSKLVINTSSDGTHIAQGLNDGAQKSTGKEKITLIEDKSGAKAKAILNSGKDIEIGGYAYTVQRDADNPNNWVLVGKIKPVPPVPPKPVPPVPPKPVPPVPPKPVINDTAKTITGLASTSYLMNQAEMSTLRQRMGDLTQSSSQSDVSGAWGRMYGGNYKTRNNDNLAKADMNYYGFQLGGDINTVHYSDNKNYLGLFMGHTTGKPDYVRGNATATSWYGGLYDTFIATNGFYVDSVVKIGQYRNSYNLKDSQDNALNGKAKSGVITLSSQAGKRFILTENDRYNVYAEPQAQLTYSRIGAFNTTASNGLRVKQGAYNSTVGRLGVLLGTQINKQSDIYLKTSYLHEFSKDVKYTLNDSPESYSVKGDGLEAGLGVNVKVNDNGYLYAEGNYINSKSHYTGSKFNIGYRYTF